MHDIIEAIKQAKSRQHVYELIGWPKNGNSYKKLNKFIADNNIDVSHFSDRRVIKYPIVDKVCPICSNIFKAKSGDSKEKQTCSRACSNTMYRSGENHGNWKPFADKTKKSQKSDSSYRKQFTDSELKCVRCGYDEFASSVQIHHIDENRANNDRSNLMPLCANCHSALHHNEWLIEK